MKRLYIAFSIVLLCLCLVSCSKSSNKDNKPTPSASPAATATPTPVIVIDNGSGNEQTELTSVSYYVASPETGEVTAETAFISADSELTPSQIMDFFVDSMADYSVVIEYNSAELKDGVVVVDFTSDIQAVAEKGAAFEIAVLDSVAQSMLDNLSDCKGVSFLIDGGAYKTVNKSFDVGYIYMG